MNSCFLNKAKQFIVFKQLFAFGCVGVAAAAVHFTIVSFLVETHRCVPLIANVFAFMFAYNVSYLGHRFWTFSNTSELHSQAMKKFFLVAVFSFLANESLFAVFLQVFNLQYQLALFLVLILIPPMTFISSKLWAFKS